MTLRAKLIGCFCVVTVITCITSAIGYWQTRKLATALYEVGVVRLPSIQALDTLFEAKTALDASKRELLREAILFENSGAEAAGMWAAWGGVIEEEQRRQAQAWARAEKAWKEYEPLPQTPEETAKWREFAGAWHTWRTSYEKVITLLAEARATGDRTKLAAARAENDANLYEPARASRQRLAELVRLNGQSAAAAQRRSVDSQGDVRLIGWVMLGAAVASLAAAVGGGFFMSRQIGRPLGRMADAFSRIARADHSRRDEAPGAARGFPALLPVSRFHRRAA